MESMIEFVHQRIKKHKYQNGIDFTMGNGHDTLLLSDYCHHVYSYDILPFIYSLYRYSYRCEKSNR